MRINISNYNIGSAVNDDEFKVSFDTDITFCKENNKLFNKQLAQSLREFADMLDSPELEDSQLF